MRKSNRPRVVSQPKAYQGMQKGINLIAEVVLPTFGPLPRHVAVDRIVKTEREKHPELLDNGGVIARRILELHDKDADMGAMFTRQMLWRQHELVGDGTALAAVLFQFVYNEGIKYITAGGSPMRLSSCLEKGWRAILSDLKAMALPLEGQEQLTQLAESICHDPPLSRALGEIFDIIGEHGQLEVRSGYTRQVEIEFIRGAYFKGGLLSQAMMPNSAPRVQIGEVAILVSDLEIEEPAQIIPVLQMVFDAGVKSLLIIARKLSDKVTSVLVSISRDPSRFQVIAAKAPDALHGMTEFIEDLAILTGGRALLSATGDSLNSLQLDDLGGARNVWADKEYLRIVGGKGSAQKLRAHVASLRAFYENAEKTEVRQKTRERIGKLMGGSAAIWIGGLSDNAVKARKELAERTSQTMRSTLMKGILPGGGAALLACRPRLQALAKQAEDLDERTAYRILIRALEEPTRVIVSNAGYTPGTIIHHIDEAGPGCGFDVRSGEIVDMMNAGVIDSAGVVMTAIHEAVSSAALALTVDVLVHHRRPETAYEP